MKGARFGVVTGLVTALTALAFFRVTFQNRVPPLEPNALQNQPGDYLQSAVHQPIKWRPFSSEAFDEARKTSKPTLLVIGTPWSRLARFVDRRCFSDDVIANVINHDFIPIRVDGSESPTWLSAFLPISRLRPGFYAGFQAWVLDNHGRLLKLIGASKDPKLLDSGGITTTVDPQRLLDAFAFRDDLRDAEDLFAQDALKEILPPMPERQHDEVAQLQGELANAVPLFDAYSRALAVEGSTKAGGFPEGSVNSLRPLAWLFQLRTGQSDAMRSSLERYLTSRSVDIVHGGFFAARIIGEHPSVAVDEVTTTNAQMAQTLAEAALAEHEPVYQAIAQRTFDMLVGDLRTDGLFAGCRLGDELITERSPTFSFSPLRIRTVFPGADRDWVQSNLGLNLGDNTQRLPYPVSMDVYQDPRLQPILAKMRAVGPAKANQAATGFMDINGTTCACLLRCARLWGDRERLNEVLDTVSALEDFRFQSDDVVHVKGSTSPGTYLGDYLAYADAALQDYLATGRVQSFLNGLSVLQRGIEFFKGDDPGVYYMANPVQDPLLPVDTSEPEVSDDVREACMAQLIRLSCDYGRMLGPTDQGQRLLAIASASVSRMSDTVVKVAWSNSGLNQDQLLGAMTPGQLTPAAFSPRLAGIFTASVAFADPQCAFAVGPNAQPLADELARLRPNRLVAAVTGPVREDLGRRKAGIYVVAGSVIAGPYSVARAASAMPASLQVGVGQ